MPYKDNAAVFNGLKTAAGCLAKHFGSEESTPMRVPVHGCRYKDDDLGNPMVNDYHRIATDLTTLNEID